MDFQNTGFARAFFGRDIPAIVNNIEELNEATKERNLLLKELVSEIRCLNATLTENTCPNADERSSKDVLSEGIY